MASQTIHSLDDILFQQERDEEIAHLRSVSAAAFEHVNTLITIIKGKKEAKRDMSQHIKDLYSVVYDFKVMIRKLDEELTK